MISISCFKSEAYSVVKSPVHPDWAFLFIFHVSRLINDHCSTTLIRYFERLVLKILLLTLCGILKNPHFFTLY